MNLSYQQIKPLIISEQLKGQEIHCIFKSSDSSNTYEASARVQKEDGVAHRLKESVKENMMHYARQSISDLLVRNLGYVLGSNLSNIVRTPLSKKTTAGYSDEDKKKAVLAAFAKVSSNFYYDGAAWKSAKEHSSFEQLIKSNPVQSNYDKKILARMLVEVANTDGKIEGKEEDFLFDLIGHVPAEVDRIIVSDPISSIEMEETTAASRKSMLLLTWTMALTNLELTESENNKLAGFSHHMGIGFQEESELTEMARSYILEKTFANGQYFRDDLYKVADKIGMDRENAERVMIRYNKRNS